jgi:hypothetical protein
MSQGTRTLQRRLARLEQLAAERIAAEEKRLAERERAKQIIESLPPEEYEEMQSILSLFNETAERLGIVTDRELTKEEHFTVLGEIPLEIKVRYLELLQQHRDRPGSSEWSRAQRRDRKRTGILDLNSDTGSYS